MGELVNWLKFNLWDIEIKDQILVDQFVKTVSVETFCLKFILYIWCIFPIPEASTTRVSMHIFVYNFMQVYGFVIVLVKF